MKLMEFFYFDDKKMDYANDESLRVLINVSLNLFSKTSSKLLAKLNLENGLYSNDKMECFLKGKINLSKSASLNLITRTLLDAL